MEVLITDLDLYGRLGGGQTVYRSLVEKNPEIHFYFLTTRDDPSGIQRPANAHPIQYRETYLRSIFAKYHDVAPPRWMYEPFVRASNIALSVAGRHFDVVEVADYEQFGTLLRPALAHHHVTCERVVLSLHGRISRTIALNWMTEGQVHRALEMQEQMQYLAVDARYGISRTYLDEWQQSSGIAGVYIDPLRIIDPPDPTQAQDDVGLPSLNFIGRTEKAKGPDIFVELAWWLPRPKYSMANIIGPESYDPNSLGSTSHLKSMADNRGRDIRFHPGMSRSELAKVFASKAITILPSRRDSFNLVALESLFAGCPTAVGSGAGVARFLSERFPGVPFVPIDMKNVYACLPDIASVLSNYQRYRDQLVEALRRVEPAMVGLSLGEVYTGPLSYDSDVRDQMAQWYAQLMLFYDRAERNPVRRAKATVAGVIRARTSPAVRRRVRRIRAQLAPGHLRAALRGRLIAGTWRKNAQIADQALKARHLHERYRHVFYLPEQTDADLRRKINVCWDIASEMMVDRVRIWREIARLERLRGNDLLAATYELRVIRALGEGERVDGLGATVHTLERHGFAREARVAEAMFGPADRRDDGCATLLEEACEANRTSQRWDYEFVDDRRDTRVPRVSVIVSLYNAAEKLPFFLQTLSNQTLLRARTAEVILIDTGSPGDDYGVFKRVMENVDLPAVYARSARRETIQSAWNRGITLARGSYVTFLGADEALLPNCLEVLAAELDRDRALDWIQANSLVTSVDNHGLWASDLMTYDRSGFRQDLVYLETAYLSSVGALYRRSIHERFGYYDPSFGAAGDTEFKNRILRFIKSKALPVTLGVFWNFPEERTTQSPRAEIEDLRAWYLHRTVAGVRYAFSKRHPHSIESLVGLALRYRKSFRRHSSTDLEYANNLLTVLLEVSPNSPVLRCADGVARVLSAYRWLDYLHEVPSRGALFAPLRVYEIVSAVQKDQSSLRLPGVEPAYTIFNDNRYEQHSYAWRSN